MSLKYGLNVKKAAPAPVRRAALDDEEDDDEATETATSQKTASTRRNGAAEQTRTDSSSLGAARKQVKAAEELDPSIFDYDSFHDAKATISEAKKAAAKQEAIERKPKYINNLLAAAERRKQDQLIAREKLLQREREAEGDEFADKEKFVTEAYKQQQEEARRLEEAEKKQAEEDERRKRLMGGGMQGFYRTMMNQTEKQHQEAVEAAARLEKEGGVKASNASDERLSDAQIAAELKAKGINVHVNDEGQVTDKRELLSAGLNVAPAGRSSDQRGGADHLRTSNRPANSAFPRRDGGSQQAQRERQSRMMEEQLAAQAKRAREEEEAERQKLEKAAKSQKTDVSDAKARYLARKAAKERGEG